MRNFFLLVALYFIPLSARAEVYDKVLSNQEVLATICVFFLVYLIYAKTKSSWVFWPLVMLLSIDLAGTAHYVLIERDVFILAANEIGDSYLIASYTHIAALTTLLSLTLYSCFKKKPELGQKV